MLYEVITKEKFYEKTPGLYRLKRPMVKSKTAPEGAANHIRYPELSGSKRLDLGRQPALVPCRLVLVV